MNLIQCIHYDSGNYIWASGEVENKMNVPTQATPVGIVLHSTGDSAKDLKRYVQPSKSDQNYQELINLIGKNVYNNSWNRATSKKGVHYMIGKLKDGSIATAQMLPDNFACWGCGSGKNGSYNYDPTQHIQIELEQGNDALFDVVYKEAVALCADICARYGWTENNICSHNEARIAGFASSHTDPDTWFKKHNTTMNQFRADVKAYMEKKDDEPYAPAVGEVIRFVGTKQWTNANAADAKAKKASPCAASVKKIYKLGKSKHPYYITGNYVNGWVNAEDIRKKK